jgi:hypothetical protein
VKRSLAVDAESQFAIRTPSHVALSLHYGGALAVDPRAQRNVGHRLERGLKQLQVVLVEEGGGDQGADLKREGEIWNACSKGLEDLFDLSSPPSLA